MKKIVSLLAALALVFSSIPQANAAIISSFPYNLTNGSLADATQVMGNFNEILNDTNANAAHSGANSDITSLTGLTTALAKAYGGTVIYTGGTATGTGDALVLASTSPNSFILTAGNIVTGIASDTSTGAAATLNVHSTGAIAIKKSSGVGVTAIESGDQVIGGAYAWYYDGTEYLLLNPTPQFYSTYNVSGAGWIVNDIVTIADPDGRQVQDSGVQVAALAPLASPSLTGTPTAPTASVNDSSTQLATTEFVNPANSIATSGYQKLASGLIIQWGTSAGLAAGGDGTVTFPLAFPTTCFSVEATLTVIGADKPAIVTSKSKPSFVWHNGSTNPTETVYYVAIGN